jgi:hypothetical protein
MAMAILMICESIKVLAFVLCILTTLNIQKRCLNDELKQEPSKCKRLFTVLCYKFLSLFVIGGLK